jgi:hypothetical protein
MHRRLPGARDTKGDDEVSRRNKVISALAFALAILLAGSLLAACGSNSEAGSASGATTAQTGAAAATTSGSSSGTQGAAPGGSAPGGSSTAVYPTSAAYTQSGDTKTEDGKTYIATEQDQSAILVSDGGTLTVTNATIKTSGDTSSNDSSSFYALNAAVVAAAGSSITMSRSSIATTGTGANGAFATGEGASVTLSNVKIDATGGGGHGVMATQGGTVALTDVDITTAGANSAPLATDRGGGTIAATGGSAVATGKDSPALYSTGTITVNGGTYKATGAEAAVIEGANNIILNDVTLSSTFADKWGVMVYQSMSGDAEGSQGVFTVTGGSLDYSGANGPLFYVTNTTADITLKGVSVNVASGILLKAAAGNWGTSGSNGGTVNLVADGQSLTGDSVADNISSIDITLQNGSSLSGSINADKAAKEARLTLDASSTWNVMADSYLTSLTLTGGISGTTINNITGNGHTVYYDAADSANSALGGQTYTLSGGGTLQPAA